MNILFCFSLFLVYLTSSFCDQEIRIAVATSVSDIDAEQGEKLLVRSFMQAYEDIPLIEIHPKFRSIGDVRRFYQEYFKEELEHFRQGKLYWIQAFADQKLIGFATFELEPNEPHAAYMNLLAVHPKWQKRQIGKALTFSICREELFPDIQAINVLVRKINQEGKRFYERIGFYEYPYTRSNFVDPALLTGLRWEKQ
jgi:ribosomal protein S18 acetylase RimI-like enzyme